MERILFVIIGYFFGIIQSAYIVGKFYKIDMREHGSKNLGTTNALRTLGAKAGAIVFILDLIKPIVAIIVTMIIYNNLMNVAMPLDRNLIVLYTGFGVMLGHNYPFYLGFKGGKGVACTIGTLLFLSPALLLIIFVFGIVVVSISKYISLASISSCFFALFILFIAGYRGEQMFMLLIIALFILFKHRSNVKRLIQGNENKFTIKKKAV